MQKNQSVHVKAALTPIIENDMTPMNRAPRPRMILNIFFPPSTRASRPDDQSFYFYNEKPKQVKFPRQAWILLLKLMSVEELITKMINLNHATRALVLQLNVVLFENFLQSYKLSKKLMQTNTVTKLDLVKFLKQTVRDEHRIYQRKEQILRNFTKFIMWKNRMLSKHKNKKTWKKSLVGEKSSLDDLLEFDYADFIAGDFI